MPINYEPFKKAWQHQPASETPFLQKFKKWAIQNQPYKNLKILHNVPLSLEAACKIEVLLLSGAKVTVADNTLATPATKPEALKIFKSAGIEILSDHGRVVDDYDFSLDCGAEFMNLIRPRQGIVELTKTGSLLYGKKGLKVPILSVDDSKLKALETFFGTGDGFVRAFQMLTKQNPKDHNFLIFGFGKVGKGVAYFLKSYTQNITIIDISPVALEAAKSLGYRAFNLQDLRNTRLSIKEASVIIAATGRKHIITKSFSSRDIELFKGKLLANIGVDEFGDAFENDEILYNKVWPINFALPDPTKMRYLDPSFYAHNLGPEIIISRNFAPGYHRFPEDIDNEILIEWQNFHKEDVSMSQE